jgi:hypothetical protein
VKEVPLTLEVGGKVVGTAKVTGFGVHEITVTDSETIKKIQTGDTSISRLSVDTTVLSPTQQTTEAFSVAGPAFAHGMGSTAENVTYSDNTLFKVRDALHKAGVNDDQSLRAINEMQNHGILFRERA